MNSTYCRIIKIFALLLFCINTFSFCASSDQPATNFGVKNKKEYVVYTPGEGIAIPPISLTIEPSGTMLMQGTPNPNNASGGKVKASWVGYIHFEKKFEDWGIAFLRLQLGQGCGVEPDLMLFNQVDYNALDNNATVEPRKYWYRQYLFNKQFSVQIGKMDQKPYLDVSKYAGDDDIQFLGDMFNRSAVVEWPEDYGFGIVSKFAPDQIDFVQLGVNYFDAKADWKSIIYNCMVTAEIKIDVPKLLNLNQKKYDGNYRFFGWLNTLKHEKISSPYDNDRRVNYGFGFGFDQSITDWFGVFGRVGWQRPDLVPAEGGATIEWSWSTGIEMNGKHWRRGKDAFGFGVGQLFPSLEYKKRGFPAAVEGHLDSYYRVYVNECLTLGPDLQLIWNPNGVSNSNEGDAEPIFVYSVRANLVF